MFGIYLPYPVYEIRPYCYILFGSLAILSVGGLLPKLFAALLVWSGVTIVRMRQQYRHYHHRHF